MMISPTRPRRPFVVAAVAGALIIMALQLVLLARLCNALRLQCGGRPCSTIERSAILGYAMPVLVI
jgi:hypothetical protein